MSRRHVAVWGQVEKLGRGAKFMGSSHGDFTKYPRTPKLIISCFILCEVSNRP